MARDNSGSLRKNEQRTTDKHPNAKGKALVGGVWYWVSAWTNQGDDGPWQSLAFEEMTEEQVEKYANGGGGGNGQRQQQAAPPRQQQRAGGGSDLRARAVANRPTQPPFGDEQHFDDGSIPF